MHESQIPIERFRPNINGREKMIYRCKSVVKEGKKQQQQRERAALQEKQKWGFWSRLCFSSRESERESSRKKNNNNVYELPTGNAASHDSHDLDFVHTLRLRETTVLAWGKKEEDSFKR